MNIQSSKITHSMPQVRQQSPAQAPQEQPEAAQESKDTYSPWTPVANAGVVGAAVAVPTALGAIGHSLFPSAGPVGQMAMVVGSAAILGVGATAWAAHGAKEEFNGHPILTGMTAAIAGGAGGLAGALLSPIGLSYGWTGAAVATGVAAVGAGIITAVGIHNAKKD